MGASTHQKSKGNYGRRAGQRHGGVPSNAKNIDPFNFLDVSSLIEMARREAMLRKWNLQIANGHLIRGNKS